ncbi:Hint domain-containing protein [Aliiroseovarius subalbicans]|uniref:Hint domain-containing protein n=1 Tax=Aliiroseovarius subalbicans TaxID=2925840 RepID=UPI001F57A3C7|nr:Hint domain-containing protein [Aliiroseovarius subalbicans]MCI2399182.1 Hint domain-containing protein [Aliiroseovarius subalbicans]
MFGLRKKNPETPKLMAEPGGAWRGGMAYQAPVNLHGFAAGTHVGTQMGWRPVEAITVGDHVMTFDNGLQPVTAVTRGAYWTECADCPDHMLPIDVPAGALGNARRMFVLPEQNVMIESDAGEDLFDDPFTLVPAEALIGFRGIERQRPWQAFDVVTLHFEADQVVFAEGGALILCPAAIAGVASVDFMTQGYAPVPYRVLERDQACTLVEWMALDDAAAAPFQPSHSPAMTRFHVA